MLVLLFTHCLNRCYNLVNQLGTEFSLVLFGHSSGSLDHTSLFSGFNHVHLHATLDELLHYIFLHLATDFAVMDLCLMASIYQYLLILSRKAIPETLTCHHDSRQIDVIGLSHVRLNVVV